MSNQNHDANSLRRKLRYHKTRHQEYKARLAKMEKKHNDMVVSAKHDIDCICDLQDMVDTLADRLSEEKAYSEIFMNEIEQQEQQRGNNL